MATIETYRTADGMRYRVRYRTPENKQTSKRGFKTKKEASLFAAKIEVDMAAGEYVNPAAGRATVGELSKVWLMTKRSLKPSAYKPLEIALKVYVLPRWGDVPVGKVKPSAVEAWLTQIAVGEAVTNHAYAAEHAKPKSATTVLRALGVLAGVLDLAVKDKRLSKNPARGAENLPKKASTKAKRYLTHLEVESLAGTAPSAEYGTLVRLLAYAGLRWGEAAGLRAGDIDILRSRIRVERSATWVQREVHVGPVKNWEKRTVPIPAFLLLELRDLVAAKERGALLFEDRKTGEHLGVPDLRADRNGWWVEMCRAAVVDRLTPHDLRHTYASLAVSAGANVKALQRALGHKSASMTLDIYADLFDSDLDAVSIALDQARSREVVSTSCPPDGVGEPPPA